jgi:hypothetical protein
MIFLEKVDSMLNISRIIRKFSFPSFVVFPIDKKNVSPSLTSITICMWKLPGCLQTKAAKKDPLELR